MGPRFGKETVRGSLCAASAFRPNPIADLGVLIFGRLAASCGIGSSNGTMSLFDKFGRQITDLRISVTDRCNFRCVYCRSADPENHMPHHELLEWDEFERLARILVGMGIRKVRVTGGEPLVRFSFAGRRPGAEYLLPPDGRELGRRQGSIGHCQAD